LKNSFNKYAQPKIVFTEPPVSRQEAPVYLGARVVCRIYNDRDSDRWEEGTVTYIHPKHRFYNVRFDFPNGSFLQSYQWGFSE
jgi:ribosomal protein L35AE/L33A